MAAPQRTDFARVMAVVRSAPLPPKPPAPRPTMARLITAPPPYVDHGAMFNIPVLRIDATIPAERPEYAEEFADDDADCVCRLDEENNLGPDHAPEEQPK